MREEDIVDLHKKKLEECDLARNQSKGLGDAIPLIVEQLVQSCDIQSGFAHVDSEPMPSRSAVIELTKIACELVYPGYFSQGRISRVNLAYYYGQTVTAFFEMLAEQVTSAAAAA
jgi:serine O-acetyltransferase